MGTPDTSKARYEEDGINFHNVDDSSYEDDADHLDSDAVQDFLWLASHSGWPIPQSAFELVERARADETVDLHAVLISAFSNDNPDVRASPHLWDHIPGMCRTLVDYGFCKAATILSQRWETFNAVQGGVNVES